MQGLMELDAVDDGGEVFGAHAMGIERGIAEGRDEISVRRAAAAITAKAVLAHFGEPRWA